MTTIKEEILKSFDDTFLNIRFDTTVGTTVNIKDFLSQSIDKVVEETRKEEIKELDALWNRHKCGDKNEPLSKYKRALKFWQGYLTGILASKKVIKSLSPDK